MSEGIELYERNLAAMRQQQMDCEREQRQRECAAATAAMMGDMLGQMASNDAVAAVLIRDPKLAAEAFASSQKYMMLATLAYAGATPEQILARMTGAAK